MLTNTARVFIYTFVISCFVLMLLQGCGGGADDKDYPSAVGQGGKKTIQPPVCSASGSCS